MSQFHSTIQEPSFPTCILYEFAVIKVAVPHSIAQIAHWFVAHGAKHWNFTIHSLMMQEQSLVGFMFRTRRACAVYQWPMSILESYQARYIDSSLNPSAPFLASLTK